MAAGLSRDRFSPLEKSTAGPHEKPATSRCIVAIGISIYVLTILHYWRVRKPWVVVQPGLLRCGVVLSAAVFQAKPRACRSEIEGISRLTGTGRTPNRITA